MTDDDILKKLEEFITLRNRNTLIVDCDELDTDLGFLAGSTSRLIEKVAETLGYRVSREGCEEGKVALYRLAPSGRE